MKRIITIGGATQDIFLECAETQMLHLKTTEIKKSFLVLEEGYKLAINGITYKTGGGATNAATTFARRGFDTGIICKIGNDAAGHAVVENLKKEQIDTKNVISCPDHQTGTSFIIPCAGGDRTVLVYRGANESLTEQEFPFDVLKNAGQLYITSLTGNASKLLLPITQYAKQHNIPVATNPGTSQLIAGADTLRASLPNIDVLILNSEEANRFMFSLLQKNTAPQKNEELHHYKNVPELLRAPITYQDVCFSLTTYMTAILSAGCKIVVVTNGAEGVYVGTKNGIYFHPSLPVKACNSLGAGDAFGSGFVASLAESRSLEDAIRIGILNACSVIQHTGAKEGLLTTEQVNEQLKKLDQKLLQKF